MNSKLLSAKWLPNCLRLNVLFHSIATRFIAVSKLYQIKCIYVDRIANQTSEEFGLLLTQFILLSIFGSV